MLRGYNGQSKTYTIIEKDGWVLKRISGSHHHFMHPVKKGLVTVPHPKRDLPVGTLKSIEKQAVISLGETP